MKISDIKDLNRHYKRLRVDTHITVYRSLKSNRPELVENHHKLDTVIVEDYGLSKVTILPGEYGEFKPGIADWNYTVQKGESTGNAYLDSLR